MHNRKSVSWLVLLALLVIALAACDETEKVTIQDDNANNLEVRIGTLFVFCDVDKRIGIAYTHMGHNAGYDISATLTTEQYARFCATAAEKR